jgi:hypothetical protein
MFERYTEKARRVIFFARYEASVYGSPYIETEHMLLGILREDKALSLRFITPHVTAEALRKEIDQHQTVRESISTSVDLPLSNECKHILAYAAEEAERLGHRSVIGTGHLFLGILREEHSFAAALLQRHGVDITAVREDVAKNPPAAPGLQDQPYQLSHLGFFQLALKVNNLEASIDFYTKLSFTVVRERGTHTAVLTNGNCNLRLSHSLPADHVLTFINPNLSTCSPPALSSSNFRKPNSTAEPRLGCATPTATFFPSSALLVPHDRQHQASNGDFSVRNRLSSRPAIMPRTWIALPLLVACFFTLPSHAQSPAATPPDTPAGHTLSAWLDAFNSGDRAKVEQYVTTIDKHQSTDGMLNFSRQTTGYTLISIERSEPNIISFRLHEKAGPNSAFGVLQVTPATPTTVEVFRLIFIPPGAEFDDQPLDAAERTRVIEGVASNLTKLYVYPDVAAKMNTYVQSRAQHGDYNEITSGAVFADALTKDLRAVSNDRHLHVDYAPFKQPVTPPHAQPTPDDLNRMRHQMADNNCGFEKVEILPRNIGYLKFNMFGPPAVCAPTASAAMNLLAHTKALIIDLRENGGGDPAMVDFIVSYLFDTHEHINDLYNRSDDETTQYWTLPWVPGERLTTQPVYVLTSHGTFSGAEEFTYDLKNLKRATIVGETTGGGAHPMRGVPIDEHFNVAVPVARPINPVTKTDWEGTGVTPDYKTSRDEALPTAIKLAESKLQADDTVSTPSHPPAPAR